MRENRDCHSRKSQLYSLIGLGGGREERERKRALTLVRIDWPCTEVCVLFVCVCVCMRSWLVSQEQLNILSKYSYTNRSLRND